MYLAKEGLMRDEEITQVIADVKKEVMEEFNIAEREKKPSIDKMFSDVYDKETPSLMAQKEDLLRLLKEYPDDFKDARDYQS